MLAEDVLEDARARAAGVFGLGDLTELEGVAEQNHVSRTVGRRDGVGERELTGFIDDQHVDGILAHLGLAQSHAVPPMRLNSSEMRSSFFFE